MRLLQILLFVLAALFFRRWFRSIMTRTRPAPPPTRPTAEDTPEAGLEDLTEQDISDADYEEIP
ncbi:MAG: hypothetical protein GY838_02910 [bacterium]|nr:hypothetical protein [bacterium]